MLEIPGVSLHGHLPVQKRRAGQSPGGKWGRVVLCLLTRAYVPFVTRLFKQFLYADPGGEERNATLLLKRSMDPCRSERESLAHRQSDMRGNQSITSSLGTGYVSTWF